jgi:adenylylsulfate kinase
MESTNIFPISPKVNRSQREKLMKQRGKVIWFTGLSGSGKSTLAIQLEAVLHDKGFKTYLLDGDNIRAGLCKDLTFSDLDRRENIRRIGEVSALMVDAGLVVLSAFISPFEEDRQQVRTLVGPENYIEVFVDAPIEVCEGRDVKGIYRKARQGLIKNFTGIDSPYERPQDPLMVIETHKDSVEESVRILLRGLSPLIQSVG